MIYVATEDAIPFITQWRPAVIKNIVDGDTFDLDIDLGFESHIHSRVRLLHLAGLENRKLAVGAWETRGKERVLGKAAAKRVEELMELNGGEILVATRMDPKKTKGKYGRWLTAVLLRRWDKQKIYRDDGADLISLGDLLIFEGHAEEKKYR